MYIQEIRLLSIMVMLPLLLLSYCVMIYGSILHPSRFPTDPKKEIYLSLFLAVPGRDRIFGIRALGLRSLTYFLLL